MAALVTPVQSSVGLCASSSCGMVSTTTIEDEAGSAGSSIGRDMAIGIPDRIRSAAEQELDVSCED